MKDERKTKKQLVAELTEFRQRVAELEAADTEHKRAEEALRASETEKKAVLDAMSDIVLFQDTNLYIRWGNEAAGRSVGKTRQELVGCCCYELWHGRSEPCERCPVLRALEAGSRAQSITTTPDGRWWEVTGEPVCDRDGKVMGAIEIARDITERKQAEEALRESEERYRSIFETVPTSIVLIDKDGQIVDINPYHLSHITRGKFTKKDFVGKNIVTHPTIVNAGLSETYRKVFEGEPFDQKDVYFPTTMPGSDGYFNVKGVPLLKDGEVIGAVTMHEDITKRVRAEEALRESEARLMEVVEHMPVLFDALDENGTALFWNKECERVTGYSADEIVGNPKSLELVCPDPEYRAWVLEQLHELGSYYRDWELDVQCKNGETRTIVWSNISRDHPLPGWWSWGIGVDVTERKRAEEALRESEKRLRFVLEGSQQGFWDWDIETGEVQRNTRWAEMLGYTLQEIEFTVKQWTDLIHPDDRAAAWKSIQDHLEGRTPLHEIEYRMLTKDGQYKWILDRARIVKRAPQGRPLRMSGTHTDITGRKRAEEELQRLYEQAQRDAEAKAMLLREVNHRVKNNLSAIIGMLYAERSRAEVADQPMYRAITQSLMNRVNGLTTVHNLLSASEWAPLLLSDLTGQIIRSSLHMLPRGKSVPVEVTPSSVRVTPDQAHNLALVINELATNTIKHALQERDTAHITVRIALEEDDTVQFEFRDDGPGYPEDVLRLERYSVGFELIQNIVRRGLQGELSLRTDDGAVAVIRFQVQV